jgi:hypothetical protein
MHARHKNMKAINLLASRKQHWKGQTIREKVDNCCLLSTKIKIKDIFTNKKIS